MYITRALFLQHARIAQSQIIITMIDLISYDNTKIDTDTNFFKN